MVWWANLTGETVNIRQAAVLRAVCAHLINGHGGGKSGVDSSPDWMMAIDACKRKDKPRKSNSYAGLKTTLKQFGYFTGRCIEIIECAANEQRNAQA
jgi:hypothetical protein